MTIESRKSLVVGSGFEPLKAEPADLQSAPIGRSGNPPIRWATRKSTSSNKLMGIMLLDGKIDCLDN